MNIAFLKDNLIRFRNNAHDKKLSFPRSILQEAFLFIRFGCSPDDYFRYEFYKKSNFERDKFITYRRSQSIIHKYNDAQYTYIFSDKAEFNERFDEYLGRDWIDMRSCSEEEFHDFVKRYKSVLVKPFGGGKEKAYSSLLVTS